MSQNVAGQSIAGAPVEVKRAVTDQVVAGAKSLPELLAGLKAIDSPLAGQLEGKGLVASKTPWGVLASSAVTWLVAKYGLGWDEQTCAEIAGLAVLAGSYAMRWVTSVPISGWWTKAVVK